MNLYTSAITLFGLYLLGVLLVLCVGRLITRTDLYRRWAEKRGKHYPRSRMIEDLRPVQETMMDFIEASPPSRELLRRLAEAEGPIRVRELLRRVSKTESTWTAFLLIAVAGLVRFGPQGMRITGIGREIQGRMNVENAKQKLLHRGPVMVGQTLPSDHANGPSDGDPVGQVVPVAFDLNERTDFPEPARLIRRFKPGHVQAQFAAYSACDPHEKSNANKTSRIMITAADHRELTDAIVAARKLAAHEGATRELQEKLGNAVILPVGHVPPDLITLYSRAELLDLDAGEQVNLILVFPIDSNVEQGRISIFHPLGLAMLGRRVGDRLDWSVPFKVKRFEVRAVDFQPEAALAKAA